MKKLTILLTIIALGLLIFNLTKINLSQPFIGNSMIALITILASLCVIVMMSILRVSKGIEKKTKKQE